MNPKTKTCTKCGIRKRKNEFYTNVKSKSGMRSECKYCSKLYVKRNRMRSRKLDLFGNQDGIIAHTDDLELKRLLVNLNNVLVTIVKNQKTLMSRFEGIFNNRNQWNS